MIRRKNRSLPELNMTSTADISFMLLIFFLVASSMDIDKGIARLLPPADNDKQQELQVEREKLISLTITAEDAVLLNDEPIEMEQLRPRILSLLTSIGPEHLISIDASADAQYNTYFELQNEIAAAYRDVRRKHSDFPQRIADVINHQ